MLLSALGLFVAFLLTVGSTMATDYYVGNDWVINTDLEFEGDNIIVRGHINVKDGGSLTLKNSTFLVDSRRGSRKYFTVEDTGNIYVYNSTISNRFTTNNDERYFLNIYNDSIFRDSTISRLYGWNGDNPGGIRLLGGSHIIEGCTVQDSRTYGIYTRCPLILRDTVIRWTGWSRLAIVTNSRLFDMDFYIENCTFVGNVNNPGNYGIYIYDGYTGNFKRSVNVTYCNFDGLGYGIYSRSNWQLGFLQFTYNDFDRCTYGIRLWVNSLNYVLHHNHYSVRGGGYGLRLYQGSYGNLSWLHEDIRGVSAGSGSGVYLEGGGTGSHLVKDVSIWNTYYGIVSVFGRTEVRDCYVNTTNNNFHVYYGATIDVYNTDHHIGSGFVDNSGGRITAWQRVEISSVRWSDGTEIETGIVYLLNETDVEIGQLNLSRGEDHLDFLRWTTKRSYVRVNEKVMPALLDVDTYFRAAELDILETEPQDIVFTDDFVPRLTLPGFIPGMRVNVSYLILEGSVVERGRGLARVQVSLDNVTWSTCDVLNESWDYAYPMLEDKGYDLHVKATDRAGNLAELVFEGLVIDTHPPPIDLDEDPPMATNDPYLHLTGRTEPGAMMYLGQMVTTPDAVGNFTIDYPLNEGANGLILRVQDLAGNWNQLVMSVDLDTRPPSLEVLTPLEGAITSNVLITVSGKTDEDASVTVNGVVASTYKGGFSLDMELDEGDHLLTVEAIDPAGNSAVALINVVVDRTPPALYIDKPTSTDFTTTDDTAFIAGRMDDDLDYVFINGENRSALPGEFAIPVDLVEGENDFTVVIMDRAGNQKMTTITIVRDIRPPKYTIEDVTVKDGVITRSGSLRFASGPILVFAARVDEQATFSIGAAEHTGSGQFSFEHTLTEGLNTITIDVMDTMANLAEPYHYTITYDATDPPIVITSPSPNFRTEDGEVKVTGVTEDGQSAVWIDDVPAGIHADGSFELTVALEWGDNVLSIRARDQAGNEATTTLTIKREKEEVVQESGAGLYIVMLIIGLVIGAAIMFVRGSMGGPKGPEGPERPPEELPETELPPPPPGQKDGWQEY